MWFITFQKEKALPYLSRSTKDWFMPSYGGGWYSFFFILLVLIFECSFFILTGNCIFSGGERKNNNNKKISIFKQVKAANMKQSAKIGFRFFSIKWNLMIKYHTKTAGKVLQFCCLIKEKSISSSLKCFFLSAFLLNYASEFIADATVNNQRTWNIILQCKSFFVLHEIMFS